MHQSTNLIIKFISNFNESDSTVDLFTNGCCFWFAYILKGRFEGKIKYAPVENHFITEIDNRLYDITGDVTDTYLNIVDWDSYDDYLHKSRIIQQCILMLGD